MQNQKWEGMDSDREATVKKALFDSSEDSLSRQELKIESYSVGEDEI